MLLRASNNFYQGVLDAVRNNTGPGGEPDLPGLFEQMNGALTGFAPRAHEMRQLLAHFEDCFVRCLRGRPGAYRWLRPSYKAFAARASCLSEESLF